MLFIRPLIDEQKKIIVLLCNILYKTNQIFVIKNDLHPGKFFKQFVI